MFLTNLFFFPTGHQNQRSPPSDQTKSPQDSQLPPLPLSRKVSSSLEVRVNLGKVKVNLAKVGVLSLVKVVKEPSLVKVVKEHLVKVGQEANLAVVRALVKLVKMDRDSVKLAKMDCLVKMVEVVKGRYR